MEKDNALVRILGNKYFCLFWHLFAVVYITWYGTFPNWASDVTFQATASQIGLDFPWHFKMWGIFAAFSLLINITYMFRRYNYESKIARRLMYIGCGCIMITINIPSTEIMSLQLVAHWSTALLFAVLNAAAVGMFLLHNIKKSKKVLATFIMFASMCAMMIILLIAFGKNGAIESIPIWGAYLVLFLMNFTNAYEKDLNGEKAVYDKKEAAKAAVE